MKKRISKYLLFANTACFYLLSFLIPLKGVSEVDLKVLSSVVKSCQEIPPDNYGTPPLSSNLLTERCIRYRYHYSVFIAKNFIIKSYGNLRPNVPSSVVVSMMAYRRGIKIYQGGDLPSRELLLDCLSQANCNSYSNWIMGLGQNIGYSDTLYSYIPLVCSSCNRIYDVYGSKKTLGILSDFVKWFLNLGKPQRRVAINAIYGSEADRSYVAWLQQIVDDSDHAVEVYRQTKEKIERQRKEQKRRDLLQ